MPTTTKLKLCVLGVLCGEKQNLRKSSKSVKNSTRLEFFGGLPEKPSSLG
jgi:hypothetical protein